MITVQDNMTIAGMKYWSAIDSGAGDGATVADGASSTVTNVETKMGHRLWNLQSSDYLVISWNLWSE
jgi:hypothetical protein